MWFTNLFLSDEEQANIDAGNAATEKLRALNAKKHADNPEVFDDAWLAETERNLADDYIDAPREVEGAFWEGWNEGADKIRNGIGSTINTAVGTPFKLIPWQVWLALALWGAWKLGLLKSLLKNRA